MKFFIAKKTTHFVLLYQKQRDSFFCMVEFHLQDEFFQSIDEKSPQPPLALD